MPVYDILCNVRKPDLLNAVGSDRFYRSNVCTIHIQCCRKNGQREMHRIPEVEMRAVDLPSNNGGREIKLKSITDYD